MLVFRILCAIFLATAVNWSLSRPEAEILLQALPEMTTLAPLAAAIVGYFNLAVRQGWGFIVAFANGIWAGILSIFISGALFMTMKMVDGVREFVIKDFDDFLTLFSAEIEPLVAQLFNIPMIIVSLGACAVVGVLTEIVHWILVKYRQGKRTQRSSPS